MDFRDGPADAEFRAAAREVLEAAVAALPGPEPQTTEERLPYFQQFQRQIADAGYAGLAWPREYGGKDASLTEQAIFLQEYDRASAPDRLNTLGEGLAGPTIIDFGSEDHKRRFLEPILRGEEIWCQLFSEPNAGSDLAALEARAERDRSGDEGRGDGWRITGQKVWTSRAQVSAYGMLLTRTGGGPRHKGITFFLLPMDSEGVTIRPLRHMLGEAEFNEVFLDDVYVPDDLRIGDVDGGWKVAMATLSYERVALATGRVNIQRLITELTQMVRESEHAGDPATRRKLADLFARAQVQRVNGLRALASMEKGAPGPETSIGKLFSAPLVEDIADFACSLAGFDSQLDEDGMLNPWLRLAYQARGTSIAGGTTFIQRNIVAERVLGLPR
jgi:alkylation response protein AidB-like acyl-CoA dehydrogenase